MNAKTVGVLGGMGPYATLAFFKAVLDLTPAQKDWEHVRLVIDNNTQIPSRTRHLQFAETSPVVEMKKACLQLQGYPVDAIAIPCNSATFFLSSFQEEISVPILDICQITALKASLTVPSAKSVIVLGGYVTYAMRTYRRFLNLLNIDLVEHSLDEQKTVVAIIEAIKIGGTCRDIDGVQCFLEGLISRYRADAIIFGCTELNYLTDIKLKVPIIDSTQSLAQAVLVYAGLH